MFISIVIFALTIAELFCLIYIIKNQAYIKHPRLYKAFVVFSAALALAAAINLYKQSN